MKWRKISTAPKDGTRILAVVKGSWVCCASRINGEWVYLNAEDFFSESMWKRYLKERREAGASWEPTHWMPMPPQPTT